MTDLIPDDEGFTELVDPTVPRVDLVGSPANGAPGWLVLKQDANAGLLDPAYIRDLIGKTVEPEPEPAREETVTMTGSPGAIAKLIHEAALRQEAAEVAKAKYDTADRKKMSASGAAMKDGSYPIADKADLQNAIHAVGRGSGDHSAIRRHIISRAKSLGASSEIPNNWAADGSLKEGGVSKMIGGELDDGIDGLDPTVVLAEPDDDLDAPGDVNEPGSPAWEAIDAATAQKWTSIAVRLKNALGVMADREMLEAASADPDDAEAAWDLQDAQCALDYVIDTLAGFAVDEQAEAELCTEAMAAVGKALHGFDTAPLDTFEALAPVAKAGRSLSASNEQAIRDAVASLQKVLASLPAAPVEKQSSGPEVAKTANEEPNMPTATPSSDVTTESGQEPAMGSQQADAKPVAGAAVTEMTKADGKAEVVVVYDQKGRLVGIVDPDDITPVANAEAEPDDMDGTDDDSSDDSSDGDDDTQTPDLTPQPADQAGTPADAVPDEDGDVTKSTNDTPSEEVLKSIVNARVEAALTEYRTAQEQEVAKQADDRAQLVELIETLKGRVEALEEQPAEPRVFTNGAQPPRDLRGMDRGAFNADVQKALERRRSLYKSDDATEQNRLANEMQAEAIARLREIQRG